MHVMNHDVRCDDSTSFRHRVSGHSEASGEVLQAFMTHIIRGECTDGDCSEEGPCEEGGQEACEEGCEEEVIF